MNKPREDNSARVNGVDYIKLDIFNETTAEHNKLKQENELLRKAVEVCKAMLTNMNNEGLTFYKVYGINTIRDNLRQIDEIMGENK